MLSRVDVQRLYFCPCLLEKPENYIAHDKVQNCPLNSEKKTITTRAYTSCDHVHRSRCTKYVSK